MGVHTCPDDRPVSDRVTLSIIRADGVILLGKRWQASSNARDLIVSGPNTTH